MEKKKIVDKRAVRLEDMQKSDYIPFLGGRPKRKTVISADDILNMKILAHTTKTVEEFVKKG
jgi:hypothetical protein